MKKVLSILLAGIFLLLSSGQSFAALEEKAGIHILHPYELNDAIKLLRTNNDDNDNWRYVTITLSLDDLKEEKQWRNFFQQTKKSKIKPIVRLVTKFDGKNWTVPNRKNIVDQITFLDQFEWPTEEKLIIIYNEPNHKAEWGGNINPEEYARVLSFASNWAKTENNGFKILPAALDLAAPNGHSTMEAFTYLNRMHASNPEIFDSIDYWNSHSYPNPGFIATPFRSGKNSMRGFVYELAYLKQKIGRDFEVYITETGWLNNSLTSKNLNYYYRYTALNIWSDERVKAVTPFILKGDPGPFSGFAMLDRNNQPTSQYLAYQQIISNLD